MIRRPSFYRLCKAGWIGLSVLIGILSNSWCSAEIDFSREIRPILAEKCFHCHGPDAESRKADLRLDTRTGAFADLGGYTAIEPGNREASELVLRVFDTDPDSVMPPPDFHEQLTREEKEKLATWIEQGASWQEHWSFRPVDRSRILAGIDGWSRNSIDVYIQVKHRELGLNRNPEADRYTLARRAALDLTGLPPTPGQLRQFLNDEDEGAYERFIFRLLESPHYGEHRARFWLDAARYGDTHGLHFDNFREMWPYRDWVVDAFNTNVPFDRFSIEQIAGDLIENPDVHQRIATGFLRNNPSSSEGGSIPEELRVRYVNDRTATVATVFLGLTAECASCHDHKFDPISQQEFYRLAAFFNNSIDPPIDGNMRDTYPVVAVPTPQHEAEWQQLQQKKNQLLDQRKQVPDSEVAKWWFATRGDPILNSEPILRDGLKIHAPLAIRKDDGTSPIYIQGETLDIAVPDTHPATDHPFGNRGLRFEKKGGFQIPVSTFVQPNRPVTVSMWLRTPDDVKMMDLLRQQGPEDKDRDLPLTGWNIEMIPDGAFEMPFRDHTGARANALMPSETALKPQQWQHIALRYSGGQSATSLSYLVDGEWRMQRRDRETFLSDRFGDHLADEITIAGDAVGGGISDLRIYSRWLEDEEVKLLSQEFEIRQLAADGEGWLDLTDREKAMVTRFYRCKIEPEASAATRDLSRMQQRIDYLYSRIPTTLVMEEKSGPAKAFVLNRGEYDQPGKQVAPGTPAVLHPFQPEAEEANRLDLAKWLVSPENPLLARVTVNRIWQSFFGTGLVKTSEDFGIMGSPPTHPGLLDYLATEFQESGWDIKALIFQIVTSSTYRQDSRFDPHNQKIDPGNRYLARGPRRRLDAEVIRDQALAVTGILDRSIGGRSVKPYQPPGLWKAVAFQGSNTGEFQRDDVEHLHRRSLYTFWKRTALQPGLAAFDAPTREKCTVRRECTNTPLQALVLMNDEQYLEAARFLAETSLNDNPKQAFEDRIGELFLRIVGRPADSDEMTEVKILATLVGEHFGNNPKAAETLIQAGALANAEGLEPIKVATWMTVISTLLNRDDVINQS